MDNRELKANLDALEWQLICGLIAGWVMMVMKVFGVALLMAGSAGPHSDVGPLLAESIAKQLGVKSMGLDIILASAQPKSLTNKEWVLIMRPEFADALVQAGWVK